MLLACETLKITFQQHPWPTNESARQCASLNNCYLVKLMLEVWRLRKYNSTCRAPGIKVKEMLEKSQKRKVLES